MKSPGALIRGINASFPELRSMFLESKQQNAGGFDDFILELLSVISSPHLSRALIVHAMPNHRNQLDKMRRASHAMRELRRRTGSEFSIDRIANAHCALLVDSIASDGV
jgi:hypothetical protein